MWVVADSASSEPIDPDRDIDMVDAMATGTDMATDTIEGKENVAPSRVNAGGGTTSDNTENAAKILDSMRAQPPKDGGGGGRPLVPWLTELLQKSAVWQKFLPELRYDGCLTRLV